MLHIAFRARELQIFVRIILSSPYKFILRVAQVVFILSMTVGKRG